MKWNVIDSSTAETIKEDYKSPEDAKKFCQEKWPGCHFDGDPRRGARSIFVYKADDHNMEGDYIGEIEGIPDEDH